MTGGLSVIIPCWNGRHLLEQNLPSVIEAASRLDGPHEILVVDDGSTDGAAEWLAQHVPDVRVLRHRRNQGFIEAMRTAMAAASYDLLYWLNSDVQLEPEALAVLRPHFSDERMFAVSSLDVERPTCAVPVITNWWGLLGVRYLPISQPRGPIPVSLASGGHAAFSAEKLRQLGGADKLFLPMYWEDVDLCVRAQARGWRVVLEPQSRVHHQVGSTTARRYSKPWLRRCRASHRWLFTLRHSPAVTLITYAVFLARYGLDAVNAWVTAIRRVRLIRRSDAASPEVLKRMSPSAVKKSCHVPWTIAYVSATGQIQGGGEISLLSLLVALDRRRVRPLLVCPHDGELTQHARAVGIEVHQLRLPSTERGVVDGTLRQMITWLHHADVDLVHANTAGRALVLPALAARAIGLPVVWHVRVASREPWTDWICRRLSTRLLVTSRFVASRFSRAKVGERLVQIPNPVDLAHFRATRASHDWRVRYGLSAERLTIGVIGRFDAWKRFDLALEALAQARQQIPQLHLVMIGDGPQRSSLEQRAQVLGVEAAVSFVGWQADVAEAMAAMEIILHPSREHFGRVFIEAMASGKALIAAQDGAAPELLEHEQTALLVPPGIASGFAQALIRLARDPELRQRLGKAARERAECLYAADRVAEQVMRVYDELLDGA